jgi:hypothetical protein
MRPRWLVAVFLSLLAVAQVADTAEMGDFVKELQTLAPAGEAAPVCPAQGLPELTTPEPTLKDQVCAWISVSPCPTGNDCGYRFDGSCCVARCPHPPFTCLTICQAQPQ